MSIDFFLHNVKQVEREAATEEEQISDLSNMVKEDTDGKS